MEKIGKNALEFNVAALAVLRGPGVYVYLDGDLVVYVGSSASVIGRSLALNHHLRDELLQGTSMIIVPCKDLQAARELEDSLILELKPKWNQVGGWSELSKVMGYASLPSMAQVYSPRRRGRPRKAGA